MEQKNAYPHTGLILPETEGIRAEFLERDELLVAWLENLPLADPVETGKQLLKALLQLSQSDIKSVRRLKLLEIIQNPVEQVCDTLDERFVPSLLPLSSRKSQIFLLSRELYLQMATGYKQVFATQIVSNLVAREKNQHIIALHRCIMYLEKVVLLSALAYEAYPATLWHEIHLLFTYGSINKLDRIMVENRHPKITESTIKQHYKRILLFAVASPLQLGQQEMLTLFRSLPELDDRAGLVVTEPTEKKHDIGFYVNLHADAPPAHVSLIPETLHTRTLVLETGKLLGQIQQSFIDPDSDPHLAGLGQHLREILLKNWGYIPHRHFRRSGLTQNLVVVTELKNIHAYIDNASPPGSLSHLIPEAPSLIQSDHHISDSRPLFDTADSTVLTLGADEFKSTEKDHFMGGFTPDKSKAIDGNELLADGHPQSAIKTGNCQTVNRSEHGFLIDWSDASLPGINVGELISIAPRQAHPTFTLTVVRWLRNSDKGLLAGIEVLSENCRALLFRSLKADARHNPKKEFPGLLLAGNEETPAAIVMGKGLFDSNDKIILTSDSMNPIRLRLERLEESSGLFDRFQVRYLES
jgi:hypothetical protein